MLRGLTRDPHAVLRVSFGTASASWLKFLRCGICANAMCLPCGKTRVLQGPAGQKKKSWDSVFHRDADLLVPASGTASQTLMAAINKNSTFEG